MIQVTEDHINTYPNPQFSWKLAGDESQVAYRIVVRDRWKENVWDSQKVQSEERHNLSCDAALNSEEKYTWQVQVWGASGSSATYEGSTFLTGHTNWQASWVEPDRLRKPLTDSMRPIQPEGRSICPQPALEKLDPAVYMCQDFTLPEVPELAIAYVTAHGIYGMWVNGVCVSDLLAPGFTSYNKRLEYQSYEISAHLKKGKNTVAFVLADGWYTGKIGAMGIGQQFGKESALLFDLVLKDQDQKQTVIGSSKEMKWTTGPLQYSDLYIGEYYDEAKELEGWQQGTLDVCTWQAVKVCDYGFHNLTKQQIPPVSKLRVITPQIIAAPNGDLLLDAGENIVGFVSFELMMNAGDVISMEHSETVDSAGNYLQNIIGQNKDQTDYYKASRTGRHCWQPQFTFHGFRYVRIGGTADRNPAHYKIHVIGTPLRQTGAFKCSDQRLNQLQENIVRSQQGNMICIPTDCPQRERTGWTGDAQLYTPTGCYEQDLEQFLRHWMEDVRNEQLPDGQVPHIVPYMASHDIMKPPGIEGVSAAGWSDAAVIIPWRLYEAYGDKQILIENFSCMKQYMDSTEKLAAEEPAGYEEMSKERKAYQKYLWNTGFQYGDWLMPSVQMSGGSIFEVVKETGYVVATLMYAMTTNIMMKVCLELGEEELAAHYKGLNKKIRDAFAAEYMKADGTLTKDYQGVYVLALRVDAIPEALRPKALDRLVQLIHENNDLLDTGFLSVPFLLPILHKMGRRDMANRLLFRDECPSWLYEVKMGATTMWEYWNGYAPDGTPSDCSMNHFAFGCVGEYLFGTILGIEGVTPGFKKIRICPDTACGLTSAEGSYECIWGTIAVKWYIENEKVKADIVIPPNVAAEVQIGNIQKTYTCGTYHIEG